MRWYLKGNCFTGAAEWPWDIPSNIDNETQFFFSNVGIRDSGGGTNVLPHELHKRQTNKRLKTKLVDGVEVVVQGEEVQKQSTVNISY